LKYITNYLKDSFSKGTIINDYNILSTSIIGAISHPLFFIIHHLIYDMWDSIFWKIGASVVSLILLFYKKMPKFFQQKISYYWHFMLIYNLSFLITLTALNNGFSKTWFLWELIMIFILIMFVPNWMMFLFDLIVGAGFALFIHIKFYDGSILVKIQEIQNIEFDFFLYLLTYIFAIISGLVFGYSNALGIASFERAKIFKSLAGSVAHELRNPLNNINLIGMQIKEMANYLEKNDITKPSQSLITKTNLNKPSSQILANPTANLMHLTSKISESIAHANNIINIILNDLNEKKIYPHDFNYILPDKIIPSIIDKYGFKNDEERSKIIYNPSLDENNFIKIIPERFKYIIFNLIKNSLHYNNFDDFIINIGTEKRLINGVKYNSVYILDNGPGIPPNIIPKLFDDFYTNGKVDGTGLGLSFCKRNMQIFGGDIICESQINKWTKFSLLFPVIKKEEFLLAQETQNMKKILLVDDQEINLLTSQAKIKKNLSNIICDLARGGKEAIEKSSKNDYDLILMDIQMPDINGIDATRKIREFNKEVPIIALTSLDRDTFNKLVVSEKANNLFNYYLSKSSIERIFYRAITKWIIDIEDDLTYIGDKNEYLKILQHKKILLADDQNFNRALVKRNLENAGFVVIEANNGLEMLDIYKNSLDKEGVSSFDAIITDIVMPPYNGDDCSQEIRAIESSFKISYHDEIPIIAMSGNGSRADVFHYFNCKITDYYIKGSKPDLLIKIIATYLVKKPIRINNINYHQVIKSQTTEIANLNKKVLGEHFDKDIQMRIFEMFIKDIDNFLEKIDQAILENDRKNLLALIHSIKGSATNIGADRLYCFCKMIELKIKEGEIDNNLKSEMQIVYNDLKQEILENNKTKS
jgi:CheY-like chemotaxis protein/signal transduction histidine kinase/HPt (histidine-containing phosphotransfer) domain-containing protein